MEHQSILKDISQKQFQPLYILHGDEPFYIDLLTDAIIENVLSEEEREFNQTIFYGKDVNVDALVSAVKRFPMMGPYHLVVLKEAQELKKLEELAPLMEQPVASSIFVIAHKKPIDGRLKWLKTAKKSGVVFKSEKIKPWKINEWLMSFARSKDVRLDTKGAAMLREAVGEDLQRLSNDLDKLKMLQNQGQAVDANLIEKVIGISKEYNSFEMVDALFEKDMAKAVKIAEHFASNPKSHPIQQIIGLLYSNYCKLILIHAEKAFDPSHAARILKVPPFIAQKLVAASRRYTYGALARAISTLREYDMKSKGVGTSNLTTESALLKELVFKLLH